MSDDPDASPIEPLPWPVLDPPPPGWLDDTPAEEVLRLRHQSPSRRAATAHLLWRTARAALAAGERMRAEARLAAGRRDGAA